MYQSESQLINCIMKVLAKHGAVFRCNSGSAKLPDGSTFRGLPKGFSDILFIHPATGTACFIECKTPTGKLSEHQQRFLDRMQSLNARAGVATSLNEAIEICGLTLEDLL